jgi:hypothetical protein
MSKRTGPSEKEFQAQVIQLARLLDYMVYHTHDSRKSAKGFPDLVLVKHRIIFAELKIGKKVPTEAQRQWIIALREAGAETYVWWPENLPQIGEILRR